MRPIWTYNTDRPLTSECRKALEKLFESEGHWSRRLATGGVATSQSCRQGEITSFTHQVQVKDIPGGLLWRWNQTRARVLLTNEDGSSISVAKLRPRKRLTTSKSLDFNSMTGTIPSFKLWLFELKRADAFFVSVLWCQIGLQTDLLGHFPLHPVGEIIDLDGLFDAPEPPSTNQDLTELWSLEDLADFADLSEQLML